MIAALVQSEGAWLPEIHPDAPLDRALLALPDGDRIVLDLMKVPKLARDPRVRKVLSIISPVLGIRAIETDRDHLYVKLRATPAGLPEAIGKLRTAAST